MDQNPLVSEQIEAGAELVRRFNSFMPVEVAFWTKLDDDYRWNLYIASKKMDEKSFDSIYGEALRLIKEMNNPNMHLFRVRLVDSSSSLAKAALEELRRHLGSRVAIWREEGWFGDKAVEGAYIYPESIVAEPQRASVP